MFGFIKEKFKKIYEQVTTKAAAIFGRSTFDTAALEELRSLLIGADVGVPTTNEVIAHLQQTMQEQETTNPEQARIVLENYLVRLVTPEQPPHYTPHVFLLVGINGSGKTTFAAKFAAQAHREGRQPLLVAADTWRAAAVEQLVTWGNRINVDVVHGKEGQDPSAVVFDGCTRFKQGKYQTLIIDTAGRLQTKVNLMKELEKITRTVRKQLPDATISIWLTVDSMLGQNSLEQARVFNEAVKLDGIVLTKLDGTGKGGIVCAIARELHVPVVYVTYGEALDALQPFNPHEYVHGLFRA